MKLGRGEASAAGQTGKTHNCVCRTTDSVKSTDIIRQSNVELYCLGNASEEPQHPTVESHMF